MKKKRTSEAKAKYEKEYAKFREKYKTLVIEKKLSLNDVSVECNCFNCRKNPRQKPSTTMMPIDKTSDIESETLVNKGRWTNEEKLLFSHGINTHGNNWPKIATLIPSRNNEQVRLKVYNHFRKLKTDKTSASEESGLKE